MPEAKPKKSQISLQDYIKVKEKNAKSRLKLHFPLPIKIILAVPAAFFIFLVLYFLLHLRFVAEH